MCNFDLECDSDAFAFPTTIINVSFRKRPFDQLSIETY